jgi:hypothetical protein
MVSPMMAPMMAINRPPRCTYTCHLNQNGGWPCDNRHTDTQTHRHTDTQRDTERQRDRETKRQRDRETERQRDRETERQRPATQTPPQSSKRCVVMYTQRHFNSDPYGEATKLGTLMTGKSFVNRAINTPTGRSTPQAKNIMTPGIHVHAVH